MFLKVDSFVFPQRFSVGRWYEVGSIPCNIVVVYVYVCIYVSYTYFFRGYFFFFFQRIKIFFCLNPDGAAFSSA